MMLGIPKFRKEIHPKGITTDKDAFFHAFSLNGGEIGSAGRSWHGS